MQNNRQLDRSFFERNSQTVARELLGKILVRKLSGYTLAGKIVETEAYLGEEDPAAHSFAGKTERTKVLYENGGLAYIYQSRHHYLLNVSAEKKGFPGCVLIRALEPVGGIDMMKKLRHRQDLHDLCSGPAKLCEAMAIDLKLYGIDLAKANSELFIAESDDTNFKIVASSRIGISKALDWPLRFTLAGSKFISR